MGDQVELARYCDQVRKRPLSESARKGKPKLRWIERSLSSVILLVLISCSAAALNDRASSATDTASAPCLSVSLSPV